MLKSVLTYHKISEKKKDLISHVNSFRINIYIYIYIFLLNGYYIFHKPLLSTEVYYLLNCISKAY